MTEDDNGAKDGEELARRGYDAARQRAKVCDSHEDEILSSKPLTITRQMKKKTMNPN